MNKKYSRLASLILFVSVLYCAVVMTMILFKSSPADSFNDDGLLEISEAIDKNYKSVVSIIVELDKGEPEEMVLNNLREMGWFFKQIKENEKFIKIKILNEK